MGDIEEIQMIVATMERRSGLSPRLEAPVTAPVTRPGPQASRALQNATTGSASAPSASSCAAVMRAGVPGGSVDPRLFTAAASGLNETVPSEGGFLVQQDFSQEILQDVFQTGILASRCRRIPISGNANSLKINGIDETSRASTRSGGILGYWEEEAAEKTASKPKFRKIELNLKKLIGLCYATDELLQDAAALEGVIRQGFVSEFGFLLDDAIINGTGAGQPLGILNSGCLVSVDKETGQKAATVVAENVIKMYSRHLRPEPPERRVAHQPEHRAAALHHEPRGRHRRRPDLHAGGRPLRRSPTAPCSAVRSSRSSRRRPSAPSATSSSPISPAATSWPRRAGSRAT